jgi:type III pantothenate kinase
LNLVIDIGNTLTKVALFDAGQMIDLHETTSLTEHLANQFALDYPAFDACILSAVKPYNEEIDLYLQSRGNYIKLEPTIPVPIINHYRTPQTLGLDRLALATAAYSLFPENHVLVIGAGTTITYDLVISGGEYVGGAISPGIHMRYMALNKFTGNLPLLNTIEETLMIGTTTYECIQSGVLNGIICEVQGLIARYQERFAGLQIILTGGDYKYFDKQLKIKTFARPNLVLEGLNLILEYNLEKKNK